MQLFKREQNRVGQDIWDPSNRSFEQEVISAGNADENKNSGAHVFGVDPGESEMTDPDGKVQRWHEQESI